jgi:hypothetical protein
VQSRKDLNLALNIVAKCGVTPWVLPDAVPDADFFIGLSYTHSTKRIGERFFGYANVFNSFGKWMFYSGNKQTFSEDEKTHHFYNLVKRTLEQLTLSETPTIHFHYTAKFSKEDKAAIIRAARSVRPQGVYSFVWINTTHNVRLYDLSAETDGSLSSWKLCNHDTKSILHIYDRLQSISQGARYTPDARSERMD